MTRARYEPVTDQSRAVVGLLDELIASVSTGGAAVAMVRSLYGSLVRPAIARSIDADPDRVAALLVEYVTPFMAALEVRCADCGGERFGRRAS